MRQRRFRFWEVFLLTEKTRVAVLLDAGYVLKLLYLLLGNVHPTPDQVYDFAKRCVLPDEELFRIYFYHCLPFGGKRQHPISRVLRDYGSSETAERVTGLCMDLARRDYVAFRKGELSFEGWKLGRKKLKELLCFWRTTATVGPPAAMPTLEEEDVQPNFKQKGMDMKIGLDVAWLSSKRVVDRIILVAGDRDFIPAMKFARREGVQVVLVPLRNTRVPELWHHADFVREVAAQ